MSWCFPQRQPAAPAVASVPQFGPFPPRRWQVEAITAAGGLLKQHRSVLVIAATGAGKAAAISEIIARRKWHGRLKRALVLVQYTELVTQLSATIRSFGLSVEVEQADQYARQVPDLLGHISEVVVACTATLRGARLEQWPEDAFDLIIVDECHFAVAKGHLAILRHFGAMTEKNEIRPVDGGGPMLIGFTATAARGDKKGLGSVFSAEAYRYPMFDAIRDGVLVPPVIERVHVADLDISDVKAGTNGDLNEAQLEQALGDDRVLHQIAGPTVEKAGSRSTIIFAPGVHRTVKPLASILARYTDPGRVAFVHGGMPDPERKRIYDRLRDGSIQFLVNDSVLIYGFDVPRVSCVVLARLTKSWQRYAQMVGRGVRLWPEGGKTDCLVLDLYGNTGQHTLAHPADALAGEPLSEDVKREVDRHRQQGLSLQEALALAKEAEEKAAERAREEQERLEREARRGKVKAKATYKSERVDPFSPVGLQVDAKDPGPRATQAQLDALAKWGVPLDRRPSAVTAGKMLKELADRKRQGLCSYKQAAWLVRQGLRGDVPAHVASEIIEAAKANNWRVPKEMREAFARPKLAEPAR